MSDRNKIIEVMQCNMLDKKQKLYDGLFSFPGDFGTVQKLLFLFLASMSFPRLNSCAYMVLFWKKIWQIIWIVLNELYIHAEQFIFLFSICELFYTDCPHIS